MPRLTIFDLSQELIDEIFDHLHSRQDLDTLRACALTARIFRWSSRRRICSRIDLCSNTPHVREGREGRIQVLLGILKDAPEVGKHVMRLRLRIHSFDNEWVAGDPSFLELMTAITSPVNNLRELQIIGLDFPDKFADARTLEENFLRPFINPVIKKLYIHGMIHIPFSIVASSPKLKDLTLSETDFESVPFADLEAHIPHIADIPHLSVFEFSRPVGATTTLLDSVEAGFPIAHLSSLKIILAPGDAQSVEYVQRVIQMASASLTEIGFYPEYELHLEASLDFSSLHHLHTFEVGIEFSGGFATKNALSDLCRTLQTLPPANSLKNLSVSIFLGFSSYDGPDNILVADWEIFDKEVTRIAGGKARFKLELRILCDDPDLETSSVTEGEAEEVVVAQCKSVFARMLG
ncbi:hypothetical protein CPC08DRAFT_762404 [Agrocybe pediades]|nr:hypothetical protein CPC08DRAFT_762404 [Agrocybe pediades]